MSKTITKLDLVNHLHQFLGLSKTDSKELIESFLALLIIQMNQQLHQKINMILCLILNKSK